MPAKPPIALCYQCGGYTSHRVVGAGNNPHTLRCSWCEDAALNSAAPAVGPSEALRASVASVPLASLRREVDDLAQLVSAMYAEISCHLTPSLADEVEAILIARGLMSPE